MFAAVGENIDGQTIIIGVKWERLSAREEIHGHIATQIEKGYKFKYGNAPRHHLFGLWLLAMFAERIVRRR